MASNAKLQAMTATGWRRGFANLLRKENGAWWRTRNWLVQTIIWLFVLNGILAMVLWATQDNTPSQANSSVGRLMEAKYLTGLTVFFVMSGIAPIIAAIIIGQDSILDEKKSGTAAWVLSKPVSRVAFILTKIIANSLVLLVTAILLQGVIAYIQISASAGKPLPIDGFIGALGLVFLNLLFYLTLTMMLGASFNARGTVIGVPMAILFGYQIILSLVPGLASIGPWALVNQTPQSLEPLAFQAALGEPVTLITPIVANAVWSIVFAATAMWRFNREEF